MSLRRGLLRVATAIRWTGWGLLALFVLGGAAALVMAAIESDLGLGALGAAAVLIGVGIVLWALAAGTAWIVEGFAPEQ